MDKPHSILVRAGKVNPEEGKDYSGASFAVRFSADRDIELLGVGFVGVSTNSPSNKFQISVEILTDDEKIVIFTQGLSPPTVVRKGHGFTIALLERVIIPKRLFVKLRFWIIPQEKNAKGEELAVKLNFINDIKPYAVVHNGIRFVPGNCTNAVNELHYRLAH